LLCGKYLVEDIADPCEALRVIEADSMDLLVSDISMPQMTGIELVKKARAIKPQLLIILMSADIELYMSVIKTLQVNGCCQKSGDPEEIIQLVASVLGE